MRAILGDYVGWVDYNNEDDGDHDEDGGDEEEEEKDNVGPCILKWQNWAAPFPGLPEKSRQVDSL